MPNGENVSFPRLTQLIEARSAAAFELRDGERLQIVDQAGKQVAALVASKRDDFEEWLSPAHTRDALDSIMLTAGRPLVSNRRNGLLWLVEDTVGRHDLLVPACDQRRYLDYHGLPGHASCRDNLAATLAPHGIAYERIPDPVNIFMHVAILGRGEIEFREPLSEPNDHVTFRALADLVVAISACPQDQNATNGRNPTDQLVRIFEQ